MPAEDPFTTAPDPLDPEALMAGIRRRVAEKKAAGQYTVDALALDVVGAAEPWDPDRVAELQEAAVVEQHLVVAPSPRPGIGRVVTAVKRFIARAGAPNVDDVAMQVTAFNGGILGYAAGLGGEVRRLEAEVAELRGVAGSGELAALRERVAAIEAVGAEARLGRLERRAEPQAAAPEPAPGAGDDDRSAPHAPPPDAFDHVRLDALLGPADGPDLAPLLAGHGRVLHLRCGDGALAALLAGCDVLGVDARRDLVEAARAAGRDVVHADPLAFLEAAAEASLDAVAVTGLAEELPPGGVARLAAALGRAVGPGGVAIVTCRNPRSRAEMAEFWRDPRRVRPVDPSTLAALLQSSGLSGTDIAWGPDGAGDDPAPRSAAVIARR